MAASIELRWAGTTVAISPVQVAEFMRSADGPVLRKFIVVGDLVKERTRASLRAGFPRDFLGPQIVKRIVMASNGPQVLVGADRTKTLAHSIDGNPTLVFFWAKVGQVVYLRHVNHPGSDLGPYLVKKLTEALATIRGAI